MRSGGYGLTFMDNQKFYEAVERFARRVQSAIDEVNLHKNVIDPFQALLESLLVVKVDSQAWLDVEKGRQAGKSLGNALGDLHQELIGLLPGWESTGLHGGVVDLRHEGNFGALQTPVIAELKNKFNTMNSKSAKELHNTFQSALEWPQFKGHTAYLIEVVPRKPVRYDEPWTTAQRGKVERIRKIDAASVYTESSGGDENALFKVFQAMPKALADVINETPELLVLAGDTGFANFFKRAYGEQT